MVKVIIQMDGEPDKVLSGEFANVVTVSDVGDRYEVHDGILGEIKLGELPDVLAQATAETIRKAYEDPKDRIAAMFRISKLFQSVLLEEITENKEKGRVAGRCKGVIGAGNCCERGDVQWQLRH